MQDNFPEHLQRWMSMLSVTLWKVEWAKSWGDPDFMQVLASIFFHFCSQHSSIVVLSYCVVHTVQMREFMVILFANYDCASPPPWVSDSDGVQCRSLHHRWSGGC